MSWEIIRADQFCDSVRDGTHDTPKEVENGYKLVTAKHIRDGQVYPNEAYNISEKDYIKINERSKVEQWDVVMSMIGNGLGRTAVIKDKPSYAIKNLALFKIGNEVKAKWLHYFLSSEDGQGLIFNSLQGSGQPFISLNLLRAFPIPTPPYKTMENIIGHLEKFDDLIENNQKQIKLLEEAAQRLYKEWFVDLRFPGHETTPIIDGIPEGWSAGVLDDIAYESGKNEKKERRDNYDYYLPIDCLPKQSLGYTETADISLAESSLVSFVKDDIVFGAMRPYFHKVVVARDSGLTRSTCFVLNSRQNEFWAYLTMLMFSNDTVDYATQISVGTTMPYARWKDLRQMPIIIPSKMIAENFQYVAKPIIKKIGCLSKAIIYLSQARDRLLPKLMSGELEV